MMCAFVILVQFLTIFTVTYGFEQNILDSLWNRDLARNKLSSSTFQAREISSDSNIEKDKNGRPKMGVSNDDCDNARDHLDVDWDGSSLNYTCYTPKDVFPILKDVKATEECVNLPKDYLPLHFCMKDKISYPDSIPTYGDHRPLWPVFGEYRYVPPQRWLHNVEHGAVVMLYHPCTHPLIVDELRSLVKGCIRKHVITPEVNLLAEKPLALVAWGCRLLMNHVDAEQVITFIKERALHGPEGTYAKEGQYTIELLKKATIPEGSDINDSNLCPNVNRFFTKY